MGNTPFRIFLIVIIVCSFNSCSLAKKSSTSKKAGNITLLHFINEYDLPFNLQYEGERNVNKTDTVLEDPSINLITHSGKFISSSSVLNIQSITMGPRQNGVLEAMTFDDNFNHL